MLVSVIMGLGITHLATGATKLIQHRDQVRFYLPHALWTVNVLVYILLIWWGMFWRSSHEDWYVYQYLFITLYAVVLLFLAAIDGRDRPRYAQAHRPSAVADSLVCFHRVLRADVDRR